MRVRPQGDARPFEVVFVCTGNRARSALAEALLARRVADLPISVASYGTLDLGPQAPPPDLIAVAAALGVDVTAHRSRVLDPAALRSADLVVGFEPFHVSAAVVEGGAAKDRCFTIRELDSLLEGVAALHGLPVAERAREVVSAAHAGRAADSTGLAARALGDPYGRPRRVYEQTAADIDLLVTRLANVLFGPSAIRQAV